MIHGKDVPLGLLTDMMDKHQAAPVPAKQRIADALVKAGAERLAGQGTTEFHADPLAFLQQCVFTRDEADPALPVKQWPAWACPACKIYQPVHLPVCCSCGVQMLELAYIRELVHQWRRGIPRTMLVPKPRRFKVSWLFSALHLHLALTRKESALYFQSRVEEDSSLLIDRCEFILENLPASKMKVPSWERRRKPPAIYIENGSYLIGKPEGKNALRSVTATAILMDEVGFWEDARGSYDAIKPLVEKGCRLTILSSASPGFFRQLVEGEL